MSFAFGVGVVVANSGLLVKMGSYSVGLKM